MSFPFDIPGRIFRTAFKRGGSETGAAGGEQSAPGCNPVSMNGG